MPRNLTKKAKCFTLYGMTIGEKIKRMREAKGLTASQLARRVGVPHATIWNIENGKRRPGIKVLPGLSRALNISIDELLQEEEHFEEVMADPELKIMFEKVGKLSPQARKSILDFINFAYEQEKKK